MEPVLCTPAATPVENLGRRLGGLEVATCGLKVTLCEALPGEGVLNMGWEGRLGPGEGGGGQYRLLRPEAW